MKAYKENRESRDTLYQEETRARIEKAKAEGAAPVEIETVSEVDTEELKDTIETELSKN